jgi:hypothetical protein
MKASRSLLAAGLLLLAGLAMPLQADFSPQDVDVKRRFTLSGRITPPALTADTHDYNPTGLNVAAVLRLSADDAHALTGIAYQADGRLLFLHNVGANAITLADEDNGSAAANRFALTGDFTLSPDATVLIQYDAIADRWRLIGGSGGGGGAGQTADEVAFTPGGSIAADNVQDALDELDSEKAPAAPATVAKTDDHTLELSDGGKIVTMDKATANTLTVPLNSSVAFPVGTRVSVQQLGVGATSIAATGGVTLVQRGGTLVIGSAGRYAQLLKTGTDTWELNIEPRDNLSASVDPDADDDTTDGYQVGSLWRNTSGSTTWQCFSNADGAAVWREVGGSGGGWASSVLTVSTTPASVISNSNTITTVFSASVPGGTLRSGSNDRGVEINTHGVLTNVTGSNRTLVITVRYGSTVMWADTTANIGSSATARVWTLRARLYGAGGSSAQVLVVEDFTIGPAAAADTGTGDIGGSPVTFFSGKGYGTATEDSTGDLNLEVRMTLSVADSSYTVTRNFGELRRL